MNLLILSDIHGNLSALERVLDEAASRQADACVLLGDLIDYGMHSSQVLRRLEELPWPCLCSIWGNHEHAVCTEDYSRFSTPRGRQSAQYTRERLEERDWRFLRERMTQAGKQEFFADGKRCLAVHGGLDDPYWGSLAPGENRAEYRDYDYVFSGHSHVPHFFETFFPADGPGRRNRKKTVFLNPGSVGQPRNLCPQAQFALLDTDSGQAQLLRTPYDVAREQAAFGGQTDDFYRERLAYGI